jgi:hypothetical protein
MAATDIKQKRTKKYLKIYRRALIKWHYPVRIKVLHKRKNTPAIQKDGVETNAALKGKISWIAVIHANPQLKRERSPTWNGGPRRPS